MYCVLWSEMCTLSKGQAQLLTLAVTVTYMMVVVSKEHVQEA